MSKGNVPPSPTPAQLKKFNDEIAKQMSAALSTATDLTMLKTDNGHNKLHIKALAGLGIAAVAGAVAGAIAMYLNLASQVKDTEQRLDARIDRVEDKLSTAMVHLEDNVNNQLQSHSSPTQQQAQESNSHPVIAPTNAAVTEPPKPASAQGTVKH